MVADSVDADAEDLAVAFLELRFQARHVSELRRADRREVLGVREQDGPTVADPLVEVDPTFGGIGVEVGSFVIDSERHVFPPLTRHDPPRVH